MTTFIYWTLSILCIGMANRIIDSHGKDFPGWRPFIDSVVFLVVGVVWLVFCFMELV